MTKKKMSDKVYIGSASVIIPPFKAKTEIHYNGQIGNYHLLAYVGLGMQYIYKGEPHA